MALQKWTRLYYSFDELPAPVRQRAEQLGEAAAECKGKTVTE